VTNLWVLVPQSYLVSYIRRETNIKKKKSDWILCYMLASHLEDSSAENQGLNTLVKLTPALYSKVSGTNFGQETGYLDWGFLWLYSDPPGKGRDFT
jgi:hypothetical protein